MTLMIGDAEERALTEALARARKHPISLATVMRSAGAVDQDTDVLTLEERKAVPPPGRKPEQVMLPVGYRVAISFEEQPTGMCLHLSMSSMRPRVIPGPDAIAMVLDVLGVETPFGGRTWVEEFEIDGKPGGFAVNAVVVMEPAKGGHA